MTLQPEATPTKAAPRPRLEAARIHLNQPHPIYSTVVTELAFDPRHPSAEEPG